MNVAVTLIAVRCPYCVSGDEFKAMTAAGDGRFACGKCGHLAIPSDENFKCACPKCFELRLHDIRRCG
jgi:ribosomal protein S27AE